MLTIISIGVGMTKFIKPRGKVDYPELGFEAGVKAMLDAVSLYPCLPFRLSSVGCEFELVLDVGDLSVQRSVQTRPRQSEGDTDI